MEGRPFITLLDNETLSVITDTADGDGRVYDVFNPRIRNNINGPHNLSFNFLPYLDVFRVGYPNIVDINNDYYLVREIVRNRTNTLLMNFDCDHISYEMNNIASDDEGNFNQSLEEDFNYSGDISDVINEIIDGERFNLVLDNDLIGLQVYLTTRVAGRRSRLIELASENGFEILFERFDIRVAQSFERVSGVSLEVGVNIRSLELRTFTNPDGRTQDSIEIEMFDLAQVGEPDDLLAVRVGDVLRIVDEQFGVDRNERVLGIDFDPFKKSLPALEIQNYIADTSGDSQGNVLIAGGGGRELVNVPIFNRYNEISSTVDFEESSNWLNFYEPIIVNATGDYVSVYGQLYLKGTLSETTTMTVQITRYDAENQYFEDVAYSLVNYNLNSGDFQLSMPFYDSVYVNSTGRVEYYVKVIPTSGTVELSAYQSRILFTGYDIGRVPQPS